jgi:DNA-binding beta-propeller fold protein YncE
MSPDGRDVYVADFGADAVAHLRANPTTGNLVPKECVIENDASPSDPCGELAGGLAAADSVAVSPDGNSVYVVSAFSDAIVRFNRNTANGVIHPRDCIQDPGITFEDCPREQIGLERPEGVAVSPEGNSVYVVARDSNTLVVFSRKPIGRLVPQGCLVDNEFPAVPCGDSPKGLTGAHDVAVSSDGRSVYVAAQFDASVTQFDRDTASGAVEFRDCVKDDDATASYQTCPRSTPGLDGTSDVTVSADDESVYSTSLFPDNAVVGFSRESAP